MLGGLFCCWLMDLVFAGVCRGLFAHVLFRLGGLLVWFCALRLWFGIMVCVALGVVVDLFCLRCYC